ncbi:MAG: hypothetical protein ACOC8A_00465 [bacterium]
MKAPRLTTLRCVLFAALALASATGSGLLLPTLNRQREEMELSGYTEIGDAPPSLVLGTTATGPFRAIFINMLWVRAMRLQEEGKVFELVQLYDWIGKLEPRFPMVWYYAAWNMAYNVSVKFPPVPGDERWRWVQRGIEILRDKGIPYNRRAPTLYRELAWIYHHKIGASLDDAHLYYKIRLATQMQRAFGRPPYARRVAAMAKAPASREALLADAAVRELVERLNAAGVDPFALPLAVAHRSGELAPAARAVLDEAAGSPALARLDAFLRARHLREELKLDPDKLEEDMDRFGPIDWRLPDAHALYWASRSIEVMGGDVDQAANADRILIYSVENLYRRGRLRFRPATEERPAVYIPAQNFAFLPRVVAIRKAIVERYEGTAQEDPVRDNFLNFLREVIVDLFVRNARQTAQRYLDTLIEEGPEQEGLSLEEFVWDRVRERLRGMTHDRVRGLVEGEYFQALQLLSHGLEEQAADHQRFAVWLRKKYNTVGGGARNPLPPARELLKSALRQALLSFPDFQKEVLRQRFPDLVRELEQELEEERGEPAPSTPEASSPD